MLINVGTPDRIIRAVIGLALVLVPFFLGWAPVATAVAVIVGLVLIVTAMVSFCPLYGLLRISTSGKKAR